MKRKLTLFGGLAVGASIALATITLTAVPASATESNLPVKRGCNAGWYVNADEGKLMPTQTPGGLLFSGPSIVHHAVTPASLASVPTNGAFTTWGPVTGAMPLFKMETTGSYSTINKTAAGKFWSSKIASGAGSQSSPVDSPADLIGKWSGYTADTKVFSFGVGYANDEGNRALVTSVTFGGTKYDLRCHHESPSPTHTASPTVAPTTPGGQPTTPGATPTSAAGLPVTGPPTGGIIAAGVGIVAIGALAIILSRRRRARFQA